MTDAMDDDPWTCPACASVRAGDDAFCARCGTARPDRPVPAPENPGAATGPGRRDPWPVRRALVLNGVVVVAVLLAVLLSRGASPGMIRFEPATWRCDGTERAWIAAIPPGASELRVEWRLGGPAAELRSSADIARVTLEPYAIGDGTFRVPTTDPAAPECDLEAGAWTMALRDAATGALLASGDVELAAP